MLDDLVCGLGPDERFAAFVPGVDVRWTVRTASGATAVQIVRSSRRGSRTIEHVGPAHHE